MKRLLLALIMLLFPSTANAFVGSCSIQVQPLGYFQPYYANGDTTSFGIARNYCISRGGGVIAIGPGCEALSFTYPNNANLLVIKSFKTGWCADPFAASCPLPSSSIINIFNSAATALASGGCTVWALKGITPNFFYQVFGGTQAGFDSAKVFVGTKGLILRGPGCETGINIGTIQDSVSIYAYDGGNFKGYNKTFSVFNRDLVNRFKLDSLGVTLGALGNAVDVRFTNNGSIRAMNTGGTYQRVLGMGATDFIHIWPSVAAGIGLDIRKFDDSDFIMRIIDPRRAQFKDLRADSISTLLSFGLPLYTFSTLPAFGNGQEVYCTDCKPTNPATGSGTGKVARRENGVWNTGPSDPGIATDTTGVFYRPGRPAGQFGFGSSATSNGAGSILNLYGYNDLSATGSSHIDFTQGIKYYGSSHLFVERGQTTGLLLNTGVGLVNGVWTGSCVINKLATSSGVDMTSSSGTNAGFFIKGKTSGSANQQEWQDPATGNPVSYVDRTGNFHFSTTLSAVWGGNVASATTLTLPTGNDFVVTGVVTTTNITILPAGTTIKLYTGELWQLTNGGNLLIGGDFVGDGANNQDSITLTSDGTNWHEDGRSFN